MKKWMFILASLLCVLMIQSCDKDKSISYSDLPANAKVFIESYFSDETVVSAEKKKDGKKTVYDVTLSTGTELEFDSSGNWIEVDCKFKAIPSGILPTNILDYMNENYPSYTVYKVDKSYGRYDLYTTSGVILIFSAEGIYIGSQGG